MRARFDSLPIFLLAAIVVYSITALNSHGYYHGDEHYQIIEFAGFRMGTHTLDELTWEFHNKIRPTLQPTIALVLIKFFHNMGIHDPYDQASLLRLLTVLLALVCITLFVKKTEHLFKEKWIRLLYYFISYFLWFIPFLSVRFSSEIWSGLFFLVAIGFCQSKRQVSITPFLIGILFGLSFQFRFQLGISILTAFMWLMFVRKISNMYVLKTILGFLLIFVLSIFIDAWFYNEFVFTTWNYFRTQLLEGAAAGFGVSPWYFYCQKVLTYPSVFIGIPLILALIITGIKYPKSIFLWSILAFFIIHSVIAHKEERFMFPVAFLFPIVLTLGIIHFYIRVKKMIIIKRAVKSIGLLLLAINFVGLVVLATKAAGLGRMAISKYIHDHYGDQPVNLISTNWSNPYNPWQSLPTKFYLENDLENERIKNLCGYNDSLLAKNRINLLVMRKIDFDDKNCNKSFNEDRYELVKQSVPSWILKINEVYGGLDDRNVFLLYHLE